ncbi:MAG TPA: glycoside hydrolase domain-containing protein [Acidobacteriaceae bacterium]|nr:glycoside hydrolase domain-containing protein [Acidobacteriaceae bacterium]
MPAYRALAVLLCAFLLHAAGARAAAQSLGTGKSYSGFDRNAYPGDDALGALRYSFAYTGYWLNNPPGAAENGWVGKRTLLRDRGFGFLLLFNGRLDATLVRQDAAALGRADAQAAATAAAKEGFPARAIVFLDQEEGGRLLPEQKAYLFAWAAEMRKSRYRSGIYCSGIEVGSGASRISTADDIVSYEKAHPEIGRLPLWIANDQCPPSPGCSMASHSLSPNGSGIPGAKVWQYTQSPRRPQFTGECASTYASDGNCYAPGMPHDGRSFVDFDVSGSSDPSAGR